MVHKAEDLRVGRRVALKFLPDELAHDPTAKRRFEREARSALNHPKICTIHAVEEHFIVMELLQGETMRDVIAAASPIREGNKTRDVIPLKSLLDIAIQTLEGLNAGHQKSIIHRDIKPANIFITSHGQVKILDFGVAKLLETDGPEVKPFSGSDNEATQSLESQPYTYRCSAGHGRIHVS